MLLYRTSIIGVFSCALAAAALFARPLFPILALMLFLLPTRQEKDQIVHQTIDSAAGTAGIIGLAAMASASAFVIFVQMYGELSSLERWSQMLLGMNLWHAGIDGKVARMLEADPRLVVTPQGVDELHANKRIIFSAHLSIFGSLMAAIPLCGALWLRREALFCFFHQQAGKDNIRHVLIMLACVLLTVGLMLTYQPSSPIQQFRNILLAATAGVWIVLAMFYSAFVLIRTHTKVE